MTNPLVIVNASVQVAPAPDQLQQTWALISQGGTTLAPFADQLLTQVSDLTSILAQPAAITSLSWTTGTVTATTTVAHGLPNGQVVWLAIAGAVPALYNGVFPCTITGADTFTYALNGNPGSESTPGTWVTQSANELSQMATTWFGMGSQTSVYVLELGAGSSASGVTNLGTFIDAQPAQLFYGYIVPREWAQESTFITFAQNYVAPNAKTYFATTMNLQDYTAWSSLASPPKSIIGLVETPAYGVWPSNALTALSYSNGVVSATTTTAHGVSPGQWFQLTGCTPAGYNGWYQALEGTTGSTLYASLASNPGAESALGSLVASTGSSTGIGATEFSIADAIWTIASWNPSSSNLVTPLSFAYMFGATAFPLKGNGSLLTTLLNANVSYVGTGAEGGISTSILRNGRTLDGNQFNYWYAIDWTQINGDLDLANAVINGSNNPQNPLYYNQNGVTALQSVLANTINTGIGAGLILGALTLTELSPAAFALNVENGVYAGQAVVNAVPFSTYVAANPANYPKGIYGGLSVAFTPQIGFQQIIVNMTAVQLTAG